MSVMLVKDEMFDELNSKLKEKNLTIAAGPSRSTVSFTNNFTLVAPEYNNDTVIGVYRPLSECKSEPCDASKKQNIGASSTEVILCECLKPGDTNIFAKGLKDVVDVTKNSTEVIADALKDGAEKLFTDPTTLTDYQLWKNSVIYTFGVMTLIGIACMVFEAGIITPLAIRFFNKFSVDFMISQQLKKIRSSKTTNSVNNHNKDSSDQANDSSGSNSDNGINNLTSDERSKIEKLKRAIESEDDTSKAFKSVNTFKEMSSAKLFLIIYLTNHYMLSVFFSKGVHYSRKSMIINLYDRIIYNLAITMLFAIGYNKDGYSSYQSFILKCMFLPFVTGGFLFLIKKLMKNDNTYGMSILRWCPKKRITPRTSDPSTMSNSPMRNNPETRNDNANGIPSISRVQPRKHSRAGSRVSLKDQKSQQPKSTQEFLESPGLGNDSPQLSDSVLGSDSDKDSYNPKHIKTVQPQPKTSKKGVALIIFSYILSISLLPISALIVVSVAQKTSDNDNWPVGYWYYMQLAYDLTIGQLVPAFLQYYFLSCYLKGRYLQKGFMAFMAKKNFLLNSDVKALTELDSSISN
jgi:hypothetical protein